MHDAPITPHSTEHAEKLGYEDTDVAIPVLMKWGFFLVVFVGITSIVVLGIYALLVPQFQRRSANATTMRQPLSENVAQLQPDPIKDIKAYRSRESTRIGAGGRGGYGIWKDGDGKDATYVPIARGMEMLEAKGLPIQTPESAKDDVTPPANLGNGVMYVDCETATTVRAIDATTFAVTRTYKLGYTPGMARTTPAGDALWVTDSDTGEVVFNMTTADMAMGKATTGAGAHGLSFSDDGKLGFITNQGAGTLTIVNVSTQKVLGNVAVGAKPNGLVFRAH